MVDNLRWLGHSSFRIDGPKKIYFDPYQLPPDSPKADIIFITHDHFDHCSLADVESIISKDTLIISDKGAGRKLQDAKVACKEIKPLSPGDTAEIGAIKVSAVSSYNINKPFHPKASAKLGFIVAVEGIKVYQAGDTDLIPEMKNYSCDIALLPVGGTYVMTPEEAAQAALLIEPKLAIPMHYDSASQAEKFKSLLKGKIEVKILEKES